MYYTYRSLIAINIHHYHLVQEAKNTRLLKYMSEFFTFCFPLATIFLDYLCNINILIFEKMYLLFSTYNTKSFNKNLL